ncbi:MAG: hypothetical protein AAFP98_06120, partial [Pseudomonadota bacterium]
SRIFFSWAIGVILRCWPIGDRKSVLGQAKRLFAHTDVWFGVQNVSHSPKNSYRLKQMDEDFV